MHFLLFFVVKEASDACLWLKAAGFPQYVQMFEGTFYTTNDVYHCLDTYVCLVAQSILCSAVIGHCVINVVAVERNIVYCVCTQSLVIDFYYRLFYRWAISNQLVKTSSGEGPRFSEPGRY